MVKAIRTEFGSLSGRVDKVTSGADAASHVRAVGDLLKDIDALEFSLTQANEDMVRVSSNVLRSLRELGDARIK